VETWCVPDSQPNNNKYASYPDYHVVNENKRSWPVAALHHTEIGKFRRWKPRHFYFGRENRPTKNRTISMSHDRFYRTIKIGRRNRPILSFVWHRLWFLWRRQKGYAPSAERRFPSLTVSCRRYVSAPSGTQIDHEPQIKRGVAFWGIANVARYAHARAVGAVRFAPNC